MFDNHYGRNDKRASLCNVSPLLLYFTPLRPDLPDAVSLAVVGRSMFVLEP